METVFYSVADSPVGRLVVCVTEKGLFRIDRGTAPRRDQWQGRYQCVRSEEKTRPYVEQINEYFAGARREFTVPLDLRGTPFQMAVWRQLLRIPYGKTKSYTDVARAVGKPNACRAVGNANGSNPVSIVVPCHRVIASGGGLGGYGGGLPMKQFLLDLERGRALLPGLHR